MRLEQQTNRTPGVVDTPPRTLEIEGRKVPLDAYGYLADPADWSVEVTEYMAREDGLALTDDHWLMIDFLHRFYKEYGIAPELPILSRNLCKDQNNCRWTRKYIKQLFPNGAKTACRYAGLPTPVGLSCG
ncbi:MAG: TusE/DsrC/DsvC family sulfur relay protein [Candidatus Thiodiazotropha sp.]